MQSKIDWKKYVLVFCITVSIFILALSLGNFFTSRKVEELKNIQETISLDILSSETQFSLLQELACEDVDSSILSQELDSLAQKIEYGEKNFSASDEITQLKKYYSLLEIKDYLLMKNISKRCGTDYVFILYFYTTSENCSECTKQAYVLTTLRQTYPELRVYSFDYGLDLSAIHALISIYKVEDTKLPAMVINGKLYTGYRSISEIEEDIPELQEMKLLLEESQQENKEVESTQ